ncbi:MAG TPA: DUF4349 domain-containing protein [Mycobacteriales bacterium]|nr:DUF4349 domain-containing protein [Mycobacteriales bacterium]
MIDESVLTRALAEAGAVYDEPPGGRAAILAALESGSRREPTPDRAMLWRRPVPIAVAAAVVGLAAMGAVYVGSREPERTSPAIGVVNTTSPDLSTGKSGGSAPQASMPRPPVPAPAPLAATDGGSGSGRASGAGTAGGGSVAAGAPAAQAPPGQAGQAGSLAKVVKTGAVEIAVGEGKVAATLSRLETLVASTRGFVAQSKTQEFGDAPSGVVSMRVPSASYEPVLTQVRRLGEVRTATSNGQDVTAEFVDNEARLRTLRRTLAVYETLLARARSIGEVLAVQQQINGAQTQIEQLEGKLKVLTDQVSYATLTVTVVEESSDADLAVAENPSRLRAALDDAKDNFGDGLAWVIAASGTLAILLVCAGGLLVLAWGVRRAMRRRLV